MTTPHLVVDKVRDLGRVPLPGEPLTVGRSSQSGLVLPSNEVSRHHCVIECTEGGEVRLRDLESHFGTTVNGSKVSEAVLEDGDAIGVGPYRLLYVDPSKAARADGEDATEQGGLAEGSSELAQRAETLTRRDGELAQRAETLDQRDGELAQRAETLDQRDGELAQRAETLDRSQDELAQRAEALTQRDGELAQRAEALARRESVLGDETRRLDERSAALGRRETEADTAQADLDERGRSLAEARTAFDRDRETLRAEAEELARRESELADRQHALHGERDQLDAARKQLDADAADVQRRAEEVEAARQAEDVELVSLCRSLRTASEQVATARDDVSVLEALFLETDERVGEGEANGEADARDLRQREAIARKLEDAHELREAAEDILQSVVEEMCALVAREKAHASANDRSARPFPWPGRRRR